MGSFLEAIGGIACFAILLYIIISYYSNKEENEKKINYVKRNYRLENDPDKTRKDLNHEYLKAFEKIKKFEEEKIKQELEIEKEKIDFANRHGQTIFKIFKNNRVLTYEEIHNEICEEYNIQKYEYDSSYIDVDNPEGSDEGDYMFNEFIDNELLKQCVNEKYFTVGNLLTKKHYKNKKININWENFLEDRKIELLPYPKDYKL